MFINSQFRPSWWIKNRHLQTIWGAFFKGKIKLPVKQRVRLNLDDGDFVDIDFFSCELAQTESSIVLLIHGLEGSVDSHYIQGMVNELTKRDKRVGVMYFRGCSGEDNNSHRSYHSGISEDLNNVIALLAQKNIEVRYLVGFSLGGNVLLKWLGENHSDHKVKAAVAVSVPLLLKESADCLAQGFSKIYSWRLLKTLKKKAYAKKQLFSDEMKISLKEITKLNNFWQFDDKITAPLHGFKDALDYYQKSSSRQFLKSINLPTLVIQARDDPFMNTHVIPELEELSSSVQFELSEKGGHVGFVNGHWPWSAEYYLEKRVPDFLAQFD